MILKAVNISRTYYKESFLGRRSGRVDALKKINFSMRKGEILGVVGESGSGKTTLGNIVCGLDNPTAGKLLWPSAGSGSGRAQMIFQNPAGSLNPKLTVSYTLREAVAAGKGVRTGSVGKDEVIKLLLKVGLGKINIKNYPCQFSGGQQQRIVIARALALNPALLVCDEPVSAPDISIQAQIINLIKKINRNTGLSVIFIAHDIEVVNMIADNIIVINNGEIVERGRTARIIESPRDSYTKKLISSVPVNPYLNE